MPLLGGCKLCSQGLPSPSLRRLDLRSERHPPSLQFSQLGRRSCIGCIVQCSAHLGIRPVWRWPPIDPDHSHVGRGLPQSSASSLGRGPSGACSPGQWQGCPPPLESGAGPVEPPCKGRQKHCAHRLLLFSPPPAPSQKSPDPPPPLPKKHNVTMAPPSVATRMSSSAVARKAARLPTCSSSSSSASS